MEREGERVEHPLHYNSHPSGIEAICVIRHYVCDIANAMKYLWRAGLKGEDGMTRRQKEIEDCRKAVFYLRDFMLNAVKSHEASTAAVATHPSCIDCETIASCYSEDIAQAFRELWCVGLVVGGVQVRPMCEVTRVSSAISLIERHVSKIEGLNEGRPEDNHL